MKLVDDYSVDRVKGLLEAARHTDHVEALSEQFVRALFEGWDNYAATSAVVEDELAGLIVTSAAGDAEMVVHPRFRQQGIGSALLARARHNNPWLGIWAHGNSSAARQLAESQGLVPQRRLLVMELAGEPLEAITGEVPAGFMVLNMGESAAKLGRGTVEKEFLRVNNDAFSWHPEQGGWDQQRFDVATSAPWYRDEDFLLLWDVEPFVRLAGFHWTKWHEEPGLGEVYVVGLSSEYRGRGLGGPVVEMGIKHLVEGGASRVILYVEDDNEPAVRRYEKLGFTIAEEHVVYAAHSN